MATPAPPPATKPATPPPAAAPAPAPAPAKPAGQDVSRPTASEELEATFAAKATSKPEPASKEPDPAKPAEATAPPQDSDEDDYLIGGTKPAEPAPAKPAEPAKSESVPVKAPELRAAYAKSKARVAELEKQVSELKAKPIEDTERKTFTEQISNLNKKLEEATASLKFAAYEQSEEYKEKYETPFVEAWNEGVQQVTNLTVTTTEGTRKGTPDDFQAVMRESDNERAASMATEMFGANAFYVLASRRELQKLNNQRVKALSEYKATMTDRAKAEAEAAAKAKAEAEAQHIQRVTTFKKLNEEAASKYPDYFAPLEGDEEGNKLLERGYKDADLAFTGGNGLTPDQLVRLHSAIRNRAAAFGRLVHRVKMKDTKIAELEGIIKELRESTPGAGQVGRGEPVKKDLSFEDELEQLAAKNK